jgi:hypothetical protein
VASEPSNDTTVRRSKTRSNQVNPGILQPAFPIDGNKWSRSPSFSSRAKTNRRRALSNSARYQAIIFLSHSSGIPPITLTRIGNFLSTFPVSARLRFGRHQSIYADAESHLDGGQAQESG